MLPQIAYRFLKSKKSHGALSAIGFVAVLGVAVATAATLCVMSVFNGFKEILTSRLDTLTADVTITPASGKTLVAPDSLFAVVKGHEGVEEVMAEASDQALAIYETREMPVRLRGVDPAAFRRITGIDSIVIVGNARLIARDEAYASVGVAGRLGSPYPGETLMIFAPRREGRVNMANPMASFLTDSVRIASIFRSGEEEFDDNTLIVPIEKARELLQLDGESTSLMVKGRPGVTPSALAASLRGKLGENYEVSDRLQMQELNFRMVSIEKWVTFLLLFFILLIASFNIISTMTMLVIEKRRGLGILRAMGMGRGSIAAIFRWESLYVTAIGAVAGILLGVGLCLLQEHYGLIRLGGDAAAMAIQAYPVDLQYTDILILLIPLSAIAAVTSLIAGRYASKASAQRQQG